MKTEYVEGENFHIALMNGETRSCLKLYICFRDMIFMSNLPLLGFSLMTDISWYALLRSYFGWRMTLSISNIWLSSPADTGKQITKSCRQVTKIQASFGNSINSQTIELNWDWGQVFQMEEMDKFANQNYFNLVFWMSQFNQE